MRKKLAIVSSYNTVCGNASYTHVLKEALSLHYDVEVVAINYKLMSNAHSAAVAKRKKYIAEVVEKLKDYDCVNIQFEAALYGWSIASAYKNVLPLIRASRSLLFTIHRVQNPALSSPLWKVAIRNNIRIVKTLRAFYAARQNIAFGKLMQALNEHHSSGRSTSVMVHTQREREILDFYFDFKEAIDFPITFLNKSQIASCLLDRAAVRKKVFEKYSFDLDAKYIGIFGFLSENKGHHIAVNTLNALPPNYKLAIFGAQHPFGIREYNLAKGLKDTKIFTKNNNPYISSLIDLVDATLQKEKDRVAPDKQRIRFLGSLSDEDFIEAITAMDFVLVPYLETGQGGSGNASLALELESKVIFSRTLAFMELARYYPDCFEITDIGNVHEIAQRIYTWKKDLTQAQRRATSVFCIENNALIHKEALENGAESARQLQASLIASRPVGQC